MAALFESGVGRGGVQWVEIGLVVRKPGHEYSLCNCPDVYLQETFLTFLNLKFSHFLSYQHPMGIRGL